MDDLTILERACCAYGYLPSSAVIAEARAWIEAHRHTKCEICDEPLDLEAKPAQHYRSKLMADPPPIVCIPCFELWYDGLTDRAKIREKRDAQRAVP